MNRYGTTNAPAVSGGGSPYASEWKNPFEDTKPVTLNNPLSPNIDPTGQYGALNDPYATGTGSDYLDDPYGSTGWAEGMWNTDPDMMYMRQLGIPTWGLTPLQEWQAQQFAPQWSAYNAAQQYNAGLAAQGITGKDMYGGLTPQDYFSNVGTEGGYDPRTMGSEVFSALQGGGGLTSDQSAQLSSFVQKQIGAGGVQSLLGSYLQNTGGMAPIAASSLSGLAPNLKAQMMMGPEGYEQGGNFIDYLLKQLSGGV